MSAEWTPLIVVAVSILGGAATYSYQRQVDRKTTLIEKRREIYFNFIISIQRNAIGVQNAMEYQSALAGISIYGMDSVIRATAAFHDEVADKSGRIDSRKAAEKYANMLAAMRADCFASTDLSIEEMMELSPLKYSVQS